MQCSHGSHIYCPFVLIWQLKACYKLLSGRNERIWYHVVGTNDPLLTWTCSTPLAICQISKSSTAGLFQTMLKLLGMSSIDTMATGDRLPLQTARQKKSTGKGSRFGMKNQNKRARHSNTARLVHDHFTWGFFLTPPLPGETFWKGSSFVWAARQEGIMVEPLGHSLIKPAGCHLS